MKNLSAAAAILGGILWILLTLALVGAWERSVGVLTYEFLNGARPLPLALLAFALYGMYRSVRERTGRAARIGIFIALAGFGLLALGAALEFWIGGGVRDGDVDTLSLAGWLTYLSGFLVLSVGLILFGVGFYRSRAWDDYSILPFLTGLVWAAWFPLVMLDQVMRVATSNWAQLTFGGLWIAMGIILLRLPQPSAQPIKAPQETAQSEKALQENTQPERVSPEGAKSDQVAQETAQPVKVSQKNAQPKRGSRKKKR